MTAIVQIYNNLCMDIYYFRQTKDTLRTENSIIEQFLS